MHTHILRRISNIQNHLTTVALGAACLTTAFAVGIQTAGDVQPIALIQAGSTELRGDMDGNGQIDIQDVIEILEIAKGYKTVTIEQLEVDPNRDGQITIEDALRLLKQINLR